MRNQELMETPGWEGQCFNPIFHILPNPLIFRRLLLLFFFGISILRLSPTQAQNYPIQAQVQLMPSYSAFLPDLVSPGAEKLRLVLTQRDLTRTDLAVRL
ncbi:MAG: hypothetical protein HC880_15980, partial [Bacteroidia bacterium]|nr:hypothetical protein [Bacteroidia bacterium]